MKKHIDKYVVIGILILLGSSYYVFFLINSTIKYQEIIPNIESIVGEKVNLKSKEEENLNGKYYYFFFQGQDTGKPGLAVYERNFTNRYKGFLFPRLSVNPVNQNLLIDRELGALIYLYGKNPNGEIGSLKVNYMDDEKKLKINEEDYYYVIYNYKEEGLDYGGYSSNISVEYFDTDGVNITDFVYDYNSEN